MSLITKIIVAVGSILGVFALIYFSSSPVRNKEDLLRASELRPEFGLENPTRSTDLGWKKLIAGPVFDPSSGMELYTFSLDGRTEVAAHRIALCPKCETLQVRTVAGTQEVFIRNVTIWTIGPVYVVGTVPTTNSAKPVSPSTSGVIFSPPKIDPAPPRD